MGLGLQAPGQGAAGETGQKDRPLNWMLRGLYCKASPGKNLNKSTPDCLNSKQRWLTGYAPGVQSPEWAPGG